MFQKLKLNILRQFFFLIGVLSICDIWSLDRGAVSVLSLFVKVAARVRMRIWIIDACFAKQDSCSDSTTCFRPVWQLSLWSLARRQSRHLLCIVGGCYCFAIDWVTPLSILFTLNSFKVRQCSKADQFRVKLLTFVWRLLQSESLKLVPILFIFIAREKLPPSRVYASWYIPPLSLTNDSIVIILAWMSDKQ